MDLKSKNFYKSVIPTICASIVSGLYVVVDGIFVGRGVGAGGLGAVNIAMPLMLFIMAITMMLSMGGGTLAAIALGKGNSIRANNIFKVTLSASVLFSATMTAICLLIPEQIARFLGASDGLLELSTTYIFYYAMFSIFFAVSMSLSVFVKNDQNPNLAMYGMIAGALTNIFLDWLFVFPLEMGIMGAAIASGLGQISACIILSFHFIRKKGVLRLGFPQKEKGLFREIVKVGTPEFVTQMSSPICTLLFNLLVVSAFGDIGVSAFSAAFYIISIVLLAFIGMGQGIQPLFSRSLGEGNRSDIQYYLKKGLVLNVIMAAVIYALSFFFGSYVLQIFTNDAELVTLAKSFLDIYGISFIFASVNIVLTTYFLAIKKTKQSLMIAVSRSFIINIALILLTPMIFGKNFIFLGIVFTEAVVMVISLTLYKKTPLLGGQNNV